MEAEKFRQTVVPLYRQLYGVAMAVTGNGDDAADIVQDVMVRLWSRRDELDAVQSVKAFAVTMARNMAIDRIRSTARLTIPDSLPEQAVPPPDYGCGDVERIIDVLPPVQKEVMTLRAVADLEIDEISRVTGYTPANVRQMLSRARRKLRQIFINRST